jgi:hypothetical protein
MRIGLGTQGPGAYFLDMTWRENESAGEIMTQKQFEWKCKELEAQGYGLVEYEPQNKYAVYQHQNGSKRTIGRKK